MMLIFVLLLATLYIKRKKGDYRLTTFNYKGKQRRWGYSSGGRARDVPILNLQNISAGEPHDTETILCGSGRGRWSRASNGTSPPAYFISNDVQRESVKPSPDLASKLFCYAPFHNNRYGIKFDLPPPS